ncbi:hypothetical protein HN415_01230 [Candidatus Woesearchaeota archaeon]|jgi:hypothetical protein|nr:hypothetical protein [Candidatus Woesearchaeota archaeon]
MEDMDKFLQTNIDSDKVIQKTIKKNKRYDKLFLILKKYPHFLVFIPLLLINVVQMNNYNILNLFILTVFNYIGFIVTASAIKFVLDLRDRNVNFKNCMMTSFFFIVINFIYNLISVVMNLGTLSSTISGDLNGLITFLVFKFVMWIIYFIIIWSVFSVTAKNLQIKDLIYALFAIIVLNMVISGMFDLLINLPKYTSGLV